MINVENDNTQKNRRISYLASILTMAMALAGISGATAIYDGVGALADITESTDASPETDGVWLGGMRIYAPGATPSQSMYDLEPGHLDVHTEGTWNVSAGDVIAFSEGIRVHATGPIVVEGTLVAGPGASISLYSEDSIVVAGVIKTLDATANASDPQITITKLGTHALTVAAPDGPAAGDIALGADSVTLLPSARIETGSGYHGYSIETFVLPSPLNSWLELVGGDGGHGGSIVLDASNTVLDGSLATGAGGDGGASNVNLTNQVADAHQAFAQAGAGGHGGMIIVDGPVPSGATMGAGGHGGDALAYATSGLSGNTFVTQVCGSEDGNDNAVTGEDGEQSFLSSNHGEDADASGGQGDNGAEGTPGLRGDHGGDGCPGGNGGYAEATGGTGGAGCAPGNGGHADAIGGFGGAGGTGGPGGAGQDGTLLGQGGGGGDGGKGEQGGIGGDARAYGGKGGDSLGTGDVGPKCKEPGENFGGTGGNAAAKGGKGGDAGSGGDAGDGGDSCPGWEPGKAGQPGNPGTPGPHGYWLVAQPGGGGHGDPPGDSGDQIDPWNYWDGNTGWNGTKGTAGDTLDPEDCIIPQLVKQTQEFVDDPCEADAPGSGLLVEPEPQDNDRCDPPPVPTCEDLADPGIDGIDPCNICVDAKDCLPPPPTCQELVNEVPGGWEEDPCDPPCDLPVRDCIPPVPTCEDLVGDPGIDGIDACSPCTNSKECVPPVPTCEEIVSDWAGTDGTDPCNPCTNFRECIPPVPTCEEIVSDWAGTDGTDPCNPCGVSDGSMQTSTEQSCIPAARCDGNDSEDECIELQSFNLEGDEDAVYYVIFGDDGFEIWQEDNAIEGLQDEATDLVEQPDLRVA